MIANAQTVLALLPAAVRNRVEEWVRSVTAILADDLAAIVVYGSAVRGGLTPQSDVDLLLVVRSDRPALLRALHDPLSLGRAAARIDCRILLHSEIAKAADVFPVFYDDIVGCHAVLAGSDPFKDLVIDDEHRRLRVEQELRDVRMRLRRLITDFALDDGLLRDGLVKKMKALRAPLSSLARLHGQLKNKDDLVSVLDVLGSRYRIDTQPLTSPGAPSPESTTKMAAAMQKLLDAAIDDVDSLNVGGAR